MSHKSAVSEKGFAPKVRQIADAVDGVAAALEKHGRHGEAITAHDAATKLRKKVDGDNVDIAVSAIDLSEEITVHYVADKNSKFLKNNIKDVGKLMMDVCQAIDEYQNASAGKALVLWYQGRYDEAQDIFERELPINDRLNYDCFDRSQERTDILYNLSQSLRRQNRFAESELLFKQVLDRRTARSPGNSDTGGAINDLASLYIEQGRYAEAEPLLKKAVGILEKDADPETYRTTALTDLALANEGQKHYSEALESIRTASQIHSERIRIGSLSQSAGIENERIGFRGTFATHLRVLDSRQAEAPSLRGELTEESFKIGQLYHDGPVGDALARMSLRFAAGTGALAAVVREYQDTLAAWYKAGADLVAAAAKPAKERNPTENVQRASALDSLKNRLGEISQRLAREFPKYAELTIPQPTSLKDAQGMLNAGEALLAFVIDQNKSIADQQSAFVWLVQPKSASFRRIVITGQEIDKEVRALRAKLDPNINTSHDSFPVNDAHDLFRDLMGPEAVALTGVKTLFVVADGPLESLPFSVLVTEPPSGVPTDYQHVAWLSRKLATVTLPTVSSLRALRAWGARTPTDKPFKGFGNPDFGGNGGQRGLATIALTRGTTVDPDLLRKSLPLLPETAIELKAIADMFGAGSSISLGPEASIPTVKATNLASYRVVAFATHALVAGDMEKLHLQGAEPAIALTPPVIATPENDGLLRASQVAQLKLNADWVVLSACNTAAPDGTPGASGLSGLAKAFFYAGARAMLVSHWSVSSEPTVAITTRMFREWTSHPEIGRAEALRRSMMALLDDPIDPTFTHPMAWAPFVVAGEGGSGSGR